MKQKNLPASFIETWLDLAGEENLWVGSGDASVVGGGTGSFLPMFNFSAWGPFSGGGGGTPLESPFLWDIGTCRAGEE